VTSVSLSVKYVKSRGAKTVTLPKPAVAATYKLVKIVLGLQNVNIVNMITAKRVSTIISALILTWQTLMIILTLS